VLAGLHHELDSEGDSAASSPRSSRSLTAYVTPARVFYNPFCSGEIEDSGGSSLSLLKLKRYAGEPGSQCLEFVQTFRQYHTDTCTKALVAGRDTPMPALVITQCINSLQDGSEAFAVLEQLRIAAFPAIAAAQQSKYVPWEPTAAERGAALRSRTGLPEYEEHLVATFRKRFKGLCDRAAAQNLLTTSNSSSSSSQSPASAASSGDPLRVELKVGATSTAPALRTTPIVLHDDRANPLTPNMYAVERILTCLRSPLAWPRSSTRTSSKR
jgi:hypothetical protein